MKAIQIARIFNIMLVLSLVSGTASACQMSTPTATPTMIPTVTASPTSTPRPTATLTLTPTNKFFPTDIPNATKTEAYNSMLTVVNNFYKQGYIPSTQGRYFPLNNYYSTWAQIGWYSWTNTAFSPKDFVLTAHMAWESASDTPNESGCGITFRIQPTKEHYVVFVLSTGYIQFAIKTDKFRDDGRQYYGEQANKGAVDFSMTVVGDKIDVFINNKHITTYTGFQGKMLDGRLAYTVLSGTNASYGTRCATTQGNLWLIGP